ncbi:hypothetical protein EDB80DRAFT_873765 [Ilyonectria destructans]|nr:hypothetical protein EDB80DRAFT_873765 [Ilyonectria destructans]
MPSSHIMNTNSELTFRRFPQLPGELRDMIWNSAVRQIELPGVHFFSQTFADDNCLSLGRRYCDDSSGVDVFAAPETPLQFPNGPTSWTNENPSSYMIDGGMWTACRESRAAMERRYNTAARNTLTPPSRINPDEGDAYTATNFFVRGGETQAITILPYRDLVCLTSFSALLRIQEPFPACRGFQNPYNFAMKYNPAWDIIGNPKSTIEEWLSTLYSTRLNTIVDYVLDPSSTAAKLWFIDYRMERNELENCNVVFYGDGFRLVECPHTWGFIEYFDHIVESSVYRTLEMETGDEDSSHGLDGIGPYRFGMLSFLPDP